MKREIKGKVILAILVFITALSFTYGYHVKRYSVNNYENSGEIEAENTLASSTGKCVTYWEDNGTVITNLNEAVFEEPFICSDREGGAIIVWEDERDDTGDVYAQKIDSKGNTLWGANGTVICNATGEQEVVRLCNDGNGGAFIVWEDSRDYDAIKKNAIYAQHITVNGQLQWGEGGDLNGTLICNANGFQYSIEICNNGCSGAIISWRDARPEDVDDNIYAQYVDINGNTLWGANGTVICNATTEQGVPKICSDGNGGAIIAWEDSRDSTPIKQNAIYAQHITVNGQLQWGMDGDLNGTIICDANGYQYLYHIISDEANGAIVIYEDGRGTTADIYAQHIDSTGTLLWGMGGDLNGTVICNAYDDQWNPYASSDGNGGAFITWEDERNDPLNEDVYAQHIDSDGNTHWGEGGDLNGTLVCNVAEHEEHAPQICHDGKGGAIITWEDGRCKGGYTCIYVQRIDSQGKTVWEPNGTVICNVYESYAYYDVWGYKIYSAICSDNKNGVIIAWLDDRDGFERNIYAQRVGSSTAAGGGILPAGDDDDDDKEDVDALVPILITIGIISAIGITGVIIILIKKGIIGKGRQINS